MTDSQNKSSRCTQWAVAWRLFCSGMAGMQTARAGCASSFHDSQNCLTARLAAFTVINYGIVQRSREEQRESEPVPLGGFKEGWRVRGRGAGQAAREGRTTGSQWGGAHKSVQQLRLGGRPGGSRGGARMPRGRCEQRDAGHAGRQSALAVLLHHASSEQWPSRMTSSRSSCSNSPVAYCTLQDRGTEGCTARGGAGGQGGMQADAAQAVGAAAAQNAGAWLLHAKGRHKAMQATPSRPS